MKKNVFVKAIETNTPTNNEQNKDLCVSVELDYTGGDRDRDEGSVIIKI